MHDEPAGMPSGAGWTAAALTAGVEASKFVSLDEEIGRSHGGRERSMTRPSSRGAHLDSSKVGSLLHTSVTNRPFLECDLGGSSGSAKFHAGFWRKPVADPHAPSIVEADALDARKHAHYPARYARLTEQWAADLPHVRPGPASPERRQLTLRVEPEASVTAARERKVAAQQQAVRFHSAYPHPTPHDDAAFAASGGARAEHPLSPAPARVAASASSPGGWVEARRDAIARSGIAPASRPSSVSLPFVLRDHETHHMREALAGASYGGFARESGPLAGSPGRPHTPRALPEHLPSGERLTAASIYRDRVRQLVDNQRHHRGSRIVWDAPGHVIAQAVPDEERDGVAALMRSINASSRPGTAPGLAFGTRPRSEMATPVLGVRPRPGTASAAMLAAAGSGSSGAGFGGFGGAGGLSGSASASALGGPSGSFGSYGSYPSGLAASAGAMGSSSGALPVPSHTHAQPQLGAASPSPHRLGGTGGSLSRTSSAPGVLSAATGAPKTGFAPPFAATFSGSRSGLTVAAEVHAVTALPDL